jgi:excisionase family DNA binding protein
MGSQSVPRSGTSNRTGTPSPLALIDTRTAIAPLERSDPVACSTTIADVCALASHNPDSDAPTVPAVNWTGAKLAYSVPEFCEATSIGRSLVYEEIARGRLRATKVGSRTVILREDGIAWLHSHR